MNENIEIYPMGGGKLPNDQTALILSISAAVLLLTGCCCGLFTTIPALICAIIGFVLANKATTLYKLNPGIYTQQSLSNAKTAKVTALVALILSAIWTVFSILAIVGAVTSPEFLKEYQSQIRNM